MVRTGAWIVQTGFQFGSTRGYRTGGYLRHLKGLCTPSAGIETALAKRLMLFLTGFKPNK